jgi:hypothetical protein
LELDTAKTAFAKAQYSHVADVSKLTERLEANETRLMERLAQKKTARDVSASARRKRIKQLEEELGQARKLLLERSSGASRQIQAIRSDLDALRKLVAPTRRTAKKHGGSRSTPRTA